MRLCNIPSITISHVICFEIPQFRIRSFGIECQDCLCMYRHSLVNINKTVDAHEPKQPKRNIFTLYILAYLLIGTMCKNDDNRCYFCRSVQPNPHISQSRSYRTQSPFPLLSRVFSHANILLALVCTWPGQWTGTMYSTFSNIKKKRVEAQVHEQVRK